MAYDDRPLVENKPPYRSNMDMSVDGLIQSPDVSESGKPRQHSVRDVAQAREIVRTIVAANKTRQVVNSRITAKVNSERPYDQKRLEQEGLGWKQNFNTKVLAQIVEKVFPRFVAAVDALKYFTNSSLSDKFENSVEKTEKFRKIITEVIRGKKGWKTLLEDIAFENALFGHCIVGWLDEFSWFPKAFKQDESFVSDGTKTIPEFAQVVVLKEVMLPHELYALIEDRDAAETVGWNIKNTIEQINKASPSQLRDNLNVGGTTESWYENARRELNLCASYMAGASVINVYSLLVREVTGEVSHYRLAGDSLEEIYSKDDRFCCFNACVSFFSYQRGNGTLYGSKGIGRDIYELSSMLERIRNEIVDRSILSGKTLVQGDPKRIHTFKMSVIGAMAILPLNWTVLENKIDGNTEPFLKLDAYFQMLVDQLIGNTSPPRPEGEAFRSSAAWQLLAAREEENKDTKIARFMEQFVSLVGRMQKKILDSDTAEDDAKEAQKKLKEFLSKEEIDELREASVAGTIRDLSPIERQLIVAIAAEKQGNPLFNQRQLQVEDLTARIGSEFAERVLLPVNDPTEQVEQQRLQQMELALISQGQPVPVSPRDNHQVHLEILVPVAEQMAQAITQGQADTAMLEAILGHITEHYNALVAAGAPKAELKSVADLVKNTGKVLADLKQVDEQAGALAQESQAADAEQMSQ